MLKIGITGGIGSGKSTLSRMFKELGSVVYDSDSRAKQLMNSCAELRKQIIEAFGSQSYFDTELNRPYLAEQVFNNPDKLELLNSIVHPQVKKDFANWCKKHQNYPYVIFESAILFEAKMNDSVDRTICVLSPKPMRIERVISRDGLTAEQVEARIANQLSDDQLDSLSDYSVVNFEIEDLEDAAKVYDKRFRYEASQN